MDNFGWDTDAKGFRYTKNQYIRYHFQGSLETLAMMLEYYDFSNDADFAKKYIVPFASPVTLSLKAIPVVILSELHVVLSV